MRPMAFRICAMISLLGGLSLALPYAVDDMNVIRSPAIKASRSADTCADPSLAQIVVQAFDTSETSHMLADFALLETVNSLNAATVWGDIHPAFKAWPTQQSFTSPLFQLETPSQTQFIYAIGADAQTPPVISGFTINVAVISWVYNTQVCGSIPLMSAVLPSTTDSFYTIDPYVHSRLLADGWSDTGVVAYVLPLSNS